MHSQTTVPNAPVTGGNARYPAEGPAYAPSAAAVINAAGTIDAATGPSTNCVLQNGTTAPCGAGGSSNAVTLQGRALAATAPTNNQVVLWNAGGATWQPSGLFFNQIAGVATDAQLPAPGGDVSGTLENLAVNKLRGLVVSLTPPSDGQALVWNAAASQWQPTNQTGSSSSNATTLQGRNLAATAPSDGQVIVWNAGANMWQPGGVISFNSRKGAVVPAAADYTAAQVTNAADVTQTYADPVWITSLSPLKVGSGVNQWNANKINNQPLNALASGLYYFTLGVPAAITGTASNCVHVDGSTAACGSGGGGPGVTLVESETPGGTVDGTNVTFTLAAIPNTGTLKLYMNGLRQEAGLDYTLSGFTITFVSAATPAISAVLLADYELGSGGGGSGASSASQLSDLSSTLSGLALSTGALCSFAAPCNVRFGSHVYSLLNGGVGTLSGAATGTVFIYIDNGGLLTYGHNLTIACSGGCVSTSGITSFPADSIPLATWTATSGTWDVAGHVDFRSFLSRTNVTTGQGLTSVEVSGLTTISADPTAVLFKGDVSGATGATLCKDSSGNATTTGCSGGGGGGTINVSGQGFFAGPWGAPSVTVDLNFLPQHANPKYAQFVPVANITPEKLVVWVGTLTTNPSHIAAAVYLPDCSAQVSNGAVTTATVGATGKLELLFATPPALLAGHVYIVGFTADTAETVDLYQVEGDAGGIYAAMANETSKPRFFTGATGPGGSGGTLAMPAACGALTASGQFPIAWTLLP